VDRFLPPPTSEELHAIFMDLRYVVISIVMLAIWVAIWGRFSRYLFCSVLMPLPTLSYYAYTHGKNYEHEKWKLNEWETARNQLKNKNEAERHYRSVDRRKGSNVSEYGSNTHIMVSWMYLNTLARHIHEDIIAGGKTDPNLRDRLLVV